MWVVIIAEGFVILLLAVLVIGLLRSHAEILRRLHDLGADVYDDGRGAGAAQAAQPVAFETAAGVPEPRATPGTGVSDIAGVTPTGSSVAVGVAGADHSTLIAFLSSGCLTCQTFWEAFAREDLDDLPGRDTRLVVVTRGPEAESPDAIASLAPATVTTVLSSEAWEHYDVPVSPYFILVDGPSSMVIGEGAAASWTQVRGLLERACADIGFVAQPSRRPLGGLTPGPDRERQVDEDLRAAGIGPGHPELYQRTVRSDTDTPT
jgi:hypothetical protein